MSRFVQADATRLPLADQSVALVFTSPPYMDARTYGISAQRDCAEWIDFMLKVVSEGVRVCRGLVLVNCAGVTRKGIYWPGCEGLLYEWWKRGGCCWRPAFWHRVGIPGSGGKQWLRADVEYILAFKGPGNLPWADNTACGHPPKWGPGGEMSHRTGSGRRINQWGHSFSTGGVGGSIDNPTCGKPRPSHITMTPFGNQQSSVGRRADGTPKPPYFNGNASRRQVVTNPAKARQSIESTYYSEPVLANPGNLIKVIVGGGAMGHPLAHENEAPFPEALAEFFVKSFCPPGGIVLDPFSGSGTTVAVAERLGRKGIGLDLRMSQCELGRRRLAHPHMRKTRPAKPRKEQMVLFTESR